MANWSLNYGINYNGKGSDKIKCNVTEKGGNGLQIVMGGAIPEAEISAEEAGKLAAKTAELANLDGADASDPESHKQCLQTIADFCLELKAAIG